MTYFSFSTHKQILYNASIIHNSITMFSLKSYYTLAGFEPGFIFKGIKRPQKVILTILKFGSELIHNIES
jgi:hypothetical protein